MVITISNEQDTINFMAIIPRLVQIEWFRCVAKLKKLIN